MIESISSLFEYFNLNCIYTYNFFLSFWDATQTMFWTLFDQSNLEDFYTTGKRRFKITQETGEFLFGAFSICAVLVGVNMLIAMMNNSYEFFAVSALYKPATALVYLWQ